MNKRAKLYLGIGLAVLVIGGGLVGGFFMAYERVQREVRVPPSGEAKTNPYLALERLLREYEFSAETVHRAAEPDDDQSLIILADPNLQIPPNQQDVWRRWVEEGGHLVFAEPPGGRDQAPFIESLGFTALEQRDDGDDADSGEDERDRVHPDRADATTRTYRCDCSVQVPLDWKGESVDWLADAWLGTDGGSADDSDGDSSRPFAISQPFGEGRATLVGDVSRFDNRHIDQGEFATLAHDISTLEAGPNTEGAATIVRFTSNRSWAAYLLGMTWPAAMLVAILVVLALLEGRYRFGPIVPPPTDERRSRVEHIRATGQFLWDHDAAERLLEATREPLLEELERQNPVLRGTEGRERRRMVGEILDLDDDERWAILDPQPPESAEQFTQRIRMMEHYRRQL